MTKRPLWANVLAAIALVFLLLLIFLLSLKWITNHGENMKIPQVTGKTMAEATEILEKEGFDVIIQDSVYVDTLKASVIVKQLPEADALVKVNRSVYLTINRSSPPMIEMPPLVGLSLRSAEMVLKQHGLKLGDTSSRPDFAKNSVLTMIYNGKEINPGMKINMGSEISVVIGSGLANYDMGVPDLFGLTYAEAQTLIEANGLSFGVKLFDADVKDTVNAFVYWQTPERLDEERRVNRIRQGQMIDIKLGSQKPARDSLPPMPPAQNPNNY
ncbi:MAG: PASTA domain-containing protein [Gemmatimonadaceae bacterium]|nr:PASTA domain-containing protein [Chitinophagaceae bacterium]